MKKIYSSEESRDILKKNSGFSQEAVEVIIGFLEKMEIETNSEVELNCEEIREVFQEHRFDYIAKHYAIDLVGCKTDKERIEKVRTVLDKKENIDVIAEFNGVIVFFGR